MSPDDFAFSEWLRANTISFVVYLFIHLPALMIKISKKEIRQRLMKFRLEILLLGLVEFLFVNMPLIVLSNLIAVYWYRILNLPYIYMDVSSGLLTVFVVGMRIVLIF